MWFDFNAKCFFKQYLLRACSLTWKSINPLKFNTLSCVCPLNGDPQITFTVLTQRSCSRNSQLRTEEVMIGALGSSSGKGVDNAQLKDQQFPTASKPATTELQGDEFWPLSGKPYFNLILAKSHLQPLYQLMLPAKMTATLPSLEVPAFLTYKGKEWQMVYHGEVCRGKRLDSNWKTFVIDNKLKLGDGCVFELMECSSEKIKFRVQILRGDIPSIFEDNTYGDSEDMPIIIE